MLPRFVIAFNAAIRVIKYRWGKQKSHRQTDKTWKSWPAIAGFEGGKGPEGKEYRQSVGAGKGKETDSPLEPREGM